MLLFRELKLAAMIKKYNMALGLELSPEKRQAIKHLKLSWS